MNIQHPLHIGLVAPSSVVPATELEKGISFLQSHGFRVSVHPTTFKQYYFYPASDQQRAQAFLDYAMDPSIDVLWFARGGYGSTHLLPLLEKYTKNKKPPKKTLLGFSDATALLEYTRTHWGWKTLHAPMPSGKHFTQLKKSEWHSLLEQLGLKNNSAASSFKNLKPISLPKNYSSRITAPVVGGNLSVWNALLGTPFEGNAKNKILFLEEVQENIARINRMMHHLEQAGGLKNTKAIILGDFLDCHDTVMSINQRPIRKLYSDAVALDFVFKGVGERNQIPVFKNVPVGHGPHFHTLHLGKKYQLTLQSPTKGALSPFGL